MNFYINNAIKQTSMKPSKSDSVLDDPSYREKYKERFMEAQKKGMDMVVYFDGTIVLIENKISLYPYKWHNKKRDFERAKLSNRSIKKLNDHNKYVDQSNSQVSPKKEEEFVN